MTRPALALAFTRRFGSIGKGMTTMASRPRWCARPLRSRPAHRLTALLLAAGRDRHRRDARRRTHGRCPPVAGRPEPRYGAGGGRQCQPHRPARGIPRGPPSGSPRNPRRRRFSAHASSRKRWSRSVAPARTTRGRSRRQSAAIGRRTTSMRRPRSRSSSPASRARPGGRRWRSTWRECTRGAVSSRAHWGYGTPRGASPATTSPRTAARLRTMPWGRRSSSWRASAEPRQSRSVCVRWGYGSSAARRPRRSRKRVEWPPFWPRVATSSCPAAGRRWRCSGRWCAGRLRCRAS